MLDSLERDRVGSEFVGLARVFRTEVKRIDTRMDAALSPLVASLRTRLRRHPRLRHEQIAGAERVYRMSIPGEFRIGEVDVVRDRARFAISPASRPSCSGAHSFAIADLANFYGPDHTVGQVLRRMRCSRGCGGQVGAAWLETGPISMHGSGRGVCHCWDRRRKIRRSADR
jgi:hypothetical protein